MVFLSDLDRTLIFSYKRDIGESICVEEKDGKKLSFMTVNSAELFMEMTRRATFIPITTRSAEQYGRIRFPNGYVPRYAVIDNGANLLVDGAPDPIWREQFYGYFRKAQPEIEEARCFLEKESRVYFEIRTVDEAFMFTKCHNSDEVMKLMEEEIQPRHTDFFTNGDKLYVIPKGTSKENALERLRERFGDTITAAGDSLFDEGMLRASDHAIIKIGELCQMKLNASQTAETSGDDPDFTLCELLKLLD